MSISSLNELQQIKWPYGAVSQVVNGLTTSTTYTYPSTLAAGYYAFNAVSLNDKAAYLVASSASNGLTVRMKSKDTKYFQLTTAASDFVFESEGAVPTADAYHIGHGPSGSSLQTIAYNGTNRYVIGSQATSQYAYVTDGLFGAYTPVYTGVAPANTSWYANGKFVIGGSSGILGGLTSSTDGVTWTPTINGRGAVWINIRYLNNLWIACGSRGMLATSTDAISWTFRSGILPQTGSVWSATVGPSFALAGNQTGYVNLSTTGVGWGSVYYPTAAVRTVLYAGGQYISAGLSGSLATSTDAVTWTSRTSTFGTTTIYEINHDGTTYVAVGAAGQLRTSTNGITWTTRTSNFGTTDINTVAYGNGLWVAGGLNGTMRTSTDTITWSTVTSGFGTTAIQKVKYLNGLWVAVGAAGQLRTSTDATTWTTRTANFGTSIIYDVSYYNGYYITAGAGGTVRYSTDAITWSTPTWTDAQPTSILYTSFAISGRLHVAGASGFVYSSTDGISWQQYYNSLLGAINAGPQSVAYNGSTYVVISDTTVALTSTDAVTWTRQTATAVNMTDVVYDNTKFVSSNNTGQIYTSTDGITWTAGTNLALTTSVTGLLYSDNQYLIYGTTATLQTSTDAVAWSVRTYAPTGSIYELVRGGATNYVAVDGASQSLAYSTSTTASTWVRASLGDTTAAAGAVGNSYIVAAGGDNILYAPVTSPTTWTRLSDTNATNVRAAATNGTTFALATDSHLYASTNGITWNISYTNPMSDVIYDSFAGVYIATDGSNTESIIVTNATSVGAGTNYSLTGFTGTPVLTRVAAYNGWYAFGAQNGEVAIGRGYTSNQQLVFSDLKSNDIQGLAIGDDVAVALTSTGQIFYLPLTDANFETQLTVSLTATSGTSSTTWINQIWREASYPYLPSTYVGTGLKYNNGLFVALMTSGAMFSSTDGINWVTMSIGQPTDLGSYTNMGTYGTGQFLLFPAGAVLYTTGGSLPSAFSLYQVNLPTL